MFFTRINSWTWSSAARKLPLFWTKLAQYNCCLGDIHFKRAERASIYEGERIDAPAVRYVGEMTADFIGGQNRKAVGRSYIGALEYASVELTWAGKIIFRATTRGGNSLPCSIRCPSLRGRFPREARSRRCAHPGRVSQRPPREPSRANTRRTSRSALRDRDVIRTFRTTE